MASLTAESENNEEKLASPSRGKNSVENQLSLIAYRAALKDGNTPSTADCRALANGIPGLRYVPTSHRFTILVNRESMQWCLEAKWSCREGEAALKALDKADADFPRLYHKCVSLLWGRRQKLFETSPKPRPLIYLPEKLDRGALANTLQERPSHDGAASFLKIFQPTEAAEMRFREDAHSKEDRELLSGMIKHCVQGFSMGAGNDTAAIAESVRAFCVEQSTKMGYSIDVRELCIDHIKGYGPTHPQCNTNEGRNGTSPEAARAFIELYRIPWNGAPIYFMEQPSKRQERGRHSNGGLPTFRVFRTGEGRNHNGNQTKEGDAVEFLDKCIEGFKHCSVSSQMAMAAAVLSSNKSFYDHTNTSNTVSIVSQLKKKKIGGKSILQWTNSNGKSVDIAAALHLELAFLRENWILSVASSDMVPCSNPHCKLKVSRPSTPPQQKKVAFHTKSDPNSGDLANLYAKRQKKD